MFSRFNAAFDFVRRYGSRREERIVVKKGF
jgi:hypothetical protein